MSEIKLFRPKQDWSVSPRTVLPTALLAHLFRPHWNYTVILDDHPAGKMGYDQARVFEAEPGEHRLHLRFVGLRRSKELRVSLAKDEERQFICGTTWLGWPTLREASPEDAATSPGSSIGEAPGPGDPASSN